MASEDDELDIEGALAEALDDGIGQTALREEDDGERRPQDDNAFPKSESYKSGDDKPTYVRDGSRFTKVEKEAVNAAKDAGATQKQAEAAVSQGWRPPWLKPEHGLDWDKAPETFRNALKEREGHFSRAVNDYTQKLNAWTPIQQRLAPYENQLKLHGSDGTTFLGNLLGAYEAINNDPESGFINLAEQFGVDIVALAGKLQDQGKQVDPEVAALRAELNAIKGGLTQREQQEQQQAQQYEQQRVEVLRAQVAEITKDLPHYEAVKPYMSALMKLVPEDTPLKEAVTQAYNMAIRAHPELSQRTLEDQRQKDIARARAAQMSPRGAPAPNGASRAKPTMSLEEEISAAIDGAV